MLQRLDPVDLACLLERTAQHGGLNHGGGSQRRKVEEGLQAGDDAELGSTAETTLLRGTEARATMRSGQKNNLGSRGLPGSGSAYGSSRALASHNMGNLNYGARSHIM